MKDFKVLAADIDMTLSSKGNGLPDVTIQAFNILHQHGVKIGLATGRVLDDRIRSQGKTWNLDFEFDFLVGMNGGMVYDALTQQHWETPLMTSAELYEILIYMKPLIEKLVIGVNAEGGGNHYAMNIQGDLLESAKRHGFDFVDKTGDYEGFCSIPAYKILFRGNPEDEQTIRDWFAKKFEGKYAIVGTFPGTVEVLHLGIDKGAGLQKYCTWNSIPMQEVITFGDNENDNTMLVDAGCGVCLKDGAEKTKACADYITDYTCEEGGVGHFLLDHYIQEKGWK